MENKKRPLDEGVGQPTGCKPCIREAQELLLDEEYRQWLEQRVFEEEQRQ